MRYGIYRSQTHLEIMAVKKWIQIETWRVCYKGPIFVHVIASRSLFHCKIWLNLKKKICRL